MIQAIKIPVCVGEKEPELSFDYEEDANVVSIYIGEEFVCSGDYDGNFKQAMMKMIEKW